jgi:uncharacterized protein (DUF2461 family)
MWRPEPKVAKKIRDAIHEDPAAWKAATRSKAFVSTWSAEIDDDEMLTRLPKEYDEAFAFGDDLRRKSFVYGHRLTQKAVTSPDFDDQLARLYTSASAYTAFLCRAVGLPF